MNKRKKRIWITSILLIVLLSLGITAICLLRRDPAAYNVKLKGQIIACSSRQLVIQTEPEGSFGEREFYILDLPETADIKSHNGEAAERNLLKEGTEVEIVCITNKLEAEPYPEIKNIVLP